MYATLTEGSKCVLGQTQIQSLEAPLPQLKAQAVDQVEDTERTPEHNDTSTTCHSL